LTDVVNELDDAVQRAVSQVLGQASKRVQVQMQDRITLTQIAPNILLNAEGLTPLTESEAFKTWFKESPVKDADDRPLVVYHATTHDIESFRTERANMENDMGAGFYFTNSVADADHNYAGEGPDLTQRIELQAERIADEVQDVIDSDGINIALDQYKVERKQPGEDVSAMEIAREIARRELSGQRPNILPVYRIR
jgi:hypothetical protein